MKEVTIYSTPTCHFCQLAKSFFGQYNIKYTDHNVAIDADKRQEMISLTGQLGVPVIVVGDSVVIGFDQVKIKNLLGL